MSGHRGMLRSGGEEFAGMFRSGIRLEAKEGKISVHPGMGAVLFRGLLEWLLLGESTGSGVILSRFVGWGGSSWDC